MTLAKSLKPSTVSLKQARNKVTSIMLHENIVGILEDTVQKFEKIWEPWAIYMHVSLMH